MNNICTLRHTIMVAHALATKTATVEKVVKYPFHISIAKTRFVRYPENNSLMLLLNLSA